MKVQVEILGEQITLSCPPGKEQNLIKAAKLVNDAMTNIKESGISFAKDRIAIMAAINIADDLVTGNSDTAAFIRTDHDAELDLIQIKNKLETVNHRVEASLNPEKDLKLQ